MASVIFWGSLFIYYVKSYTRYINEVKYEYRVESILVDCDYWDKVLPSHPIPFPTLPLPTTHFPSPFLIFHLPFQLP